jgi:hypothetical protein
MHRMLRLCVAVALATASSKAQWIHYRTEGIPRKADGSLNFEAPTPRTADGKPDFSGMWWVAGDHRPCPESIGGEKDCAEKGLGLAGQQGVGLVAATGDIGYNMKDGLPYTPWAREELRKRNIVPGAGDPHVRCLPSNPPRWYTLPHAQKIVQTPKLMVMLNEYNASYRQIFMDGRPLPVDPIGSWTGYSTAHWDKDTLVIESIGFRDDLWLDMKGNPMTSEAKMTERISRPKFGTMEIELTINDPKAYTKPWTSKFENFLVIDTEMMDEMCMENEKSAAHMPK